MELLKKTNDLVFKELFGERNKEIMVAFLKSILNIPDDDFEDLEFVDTHTKAGRPAESEYILDLKLKTKNRVIDVEMQVERSPVMRQRIIIYLANMIVDQTAEESFKYEKLKQSVNITIAAQHKMVPEDTSYIHKYIMNDPDKKSTLTDLAVAYILELPKLPRTDDGTELYDWLKFIKTNSEEEMKMLAEENPKIEKAYDALKNLSANEALRHEALQREMFLQDQMAREDESFGKGIEKGKIEGRIETARKMLAKNLSIEDIAEFTELPIEEIEKLK